MPQLADEENFLSFFLALYANADSSEIEFFNPDAINDLAVSFGR